MTPPIGNFFPDDLKKNLAADNFKIGAVFKFFCHLAKKEKRFIFMGEKHDKSEIALIHINSELNRNVAPTAELQNEHILLLQSGRAYLTKDSYVNCTNLVIRSKTEIFSLLEKNPDMHLGHLSAEDFKILRDKICESRLIPPYKKKPFGLFLK
ncbi:MAG: hypothetical protein JST62_08025 [Bacteroidetes bacterium]|nr:hypothetical protein [Bacteroidota bacterium]